MGKQDVEWLRGLAAKGGKGVVNAIDARSLGRIADDLERLQSSVEGSVILEYMPGVIETGSCTICSVDESPGFYTGCAVRDGHAEEWQCDAKGNLTRHDPQDPNSGWFIVELDADGVSRKSTGPYSKEEAERILVSSGKQYEVVA